MKVGLKIRWSFLTCLIVCLSQCKTLPKTENKILKSLPVSYHENKDSSISTVIKWESFFKDSNLVALINEGLSANLDQLIALQRIEVAKQRITSAKGALLPAVALNISAAQRKYGLYTMDGAGNSSTEITPGKIVPVHLPDYYAGLLASWEIDIWGRLRNKKKKAVAKYFSSIEGRNLVTTNLIAQIAANYYELRSLDNQLAIVKETIKIQDEALQIVEIQKEAASANELAVNQFEAQLLNSKSLELEVRQSITEIETKINFLLGRYPQAIKRDTTNFADQLPPSVKAGIPSDLLRNRPDIRRSEFELAAAKADVKSARAAFYPALTITGSLGYQAFKTAFLFYSPQSIAYTILGGLTAPLINRTALKRAFRTANAVQLEALYNYQKSILTGYTEVYNQMSKIERLGKMLAFKSQEAKVLTNAIETSSVLFKTGRANYMEVLMAQRNSLKSQLDLVTTKKLQYHAVIDMYKALGGGWQ
ncbi:RND transporter [Sphingobacteriaceae bacterium]|nr:RND transporter [Sphingobacteriaceae bacterium]